MMHPDKSRGLECHVDANFAGDWSKKYMDDASTCYSCAGYIIWYAGCPLIWASKMQTIIALSSTEEAEYVALSAALRDITFVMQLLKELISFGVKLNNVLPTGKCKAFEYNIGGIELSKPHTCVPHYTFDIQYHHFREAVQQKKISIQHVSTTEQVADIATKSLPRYSFQYLRK
jgi:hypothetical protein